MAAFEYFVHDVRPDFRVLICPTGFPCPNRTCWPDDPDDRLTLCPPPAESLWEWTVPKGHPELVITRVRQLIRMLEGQALIVLRVDPDDLPGAKEGLAEIGELRGDISAQT